MTKTKMTTTEALDELEKRINKHLQTLLANRQESASKGYPGNPGMNVAQALHLTKMLVSEEVTKLKKEL